MNTEEFYKKIGFTALNTGAVSPYHKNHKVIAYTDIIPLKQIMEFSFVICFEKDNKKHFRSFYATSIRTSKLSIRHHTMQEENTDFLERWGEEPEKLIILHKLDYERFMLQTGSDAL